jgi:hypothetical protein
MDHTEEIPEVPSTSATPPDAPARRVHYRRDPLPWRRRDMLLCGLLAVLGVAGVVICWVGATDEAIWRDQTGWLTGAILSTGLVILGGGLWVLIGLRRVRQGFRDLRRDQRAALGLTRVRTGAVAATIADSAEVELVTSGQMTRAHRPDCLLLRGKQAVAVPPAEAANYGRCGVCDS